MAEQQIDNSTKPNRDGLAAVAVIVLSVLFIVFVVSNIV